MHIFYSSHCCSSFYGAFTHKIVFRLTSHKAAKDLGAREAMVCIISFGKQGFRARENFKDKKIKLIPDKKNI